VHRDDPVRPGPPGPDLLERVGVVDGLDIHGGAVGLAGTLGEYDAVLVHDEQETTTVRLSGLERLVLEHALDQRVLENVAESSSAVGRVYRDLNRAGLVEAVWWPGDELPLEVVLMPAGRALLRDRAGG